MAGQLTAIRQALSEAVFDALGGRSDGQLRWCHPAIHTRGAGVVTESLAQSWSFDAITGWPGRPETAWMERPLTGGDHPGRHKDEFMLCENRCRS